MGILSLEILNLTSSISSALSCFALEYAIRKVQETNLGLKGVALELCSYLALFQLLFLLKYQAGL